MKYLGIEEKVTYPNMSVCEVFLLEDGTIWRVNSTCNPDETFKRLEYFQRQKNNPWLYSRTKNAYIVIQKRPENIEVWIHTQIPRGSRPRFPVVFTDYFDSLPELEHFLEIRYGNTQSHTS